MAKHTQTSGSANNMPRASHRIKRLPRRAARLALMGIPVLALMLFLDPCLAAGGDAGRGGDSRAGSPGSAGSVGGERDDAKGGDGGDGGNSGDAEMGGAGGEGGSHDFVGNAIPTGNLAGGNGGNGERGGESGGGAGGGGGGGGEGGIGALIQHAGQSATNVDQTITGGNGGRGGRGGTGYRAGDGGASGNGGDGGTGLFFSGQTLTHNGVAIGGTGGAGNYGSGVVSLPSGPAGTNGKGSIGGNGGIGIFFSGDALINHGGIIGGDGGMSEDVPEHGDGNGSSGGAGLVFSGTTLSNDGAITGGDGGAFGFSFGDIGSIGGKGGAGVVFSGDTLMNRGAITGGAGGSGGDGPNAGAAGSGGVGLLAQGGNVTLINAGTISGGMSGDGSTQADAITLAGDGNRLELRAGSIINGNVVASGAGNVFALGGDGKDGNGEDASFDVSLIGGDRQYAGFDHFEKTGAGAWILTGTGDQDWTIAEGALIGNTDSFGGDLSFATGAGTRGVVFDMDRNDTYAGTISGDGALFKTGGGTLVLDGQNTYQGGTTLVDGTLSVSSDTSLGDAAGSLVFDGGTLQVTGTGFTNTGRDIVLGAQGGGLDIADLDNRFTLAQNIVGDGDLVKRGAGTLVMTGANDYRNTVVENGTLIGSADSVSGNIGNAGTLVFEQADNASFAGDVSGLDGNNGKMVKRGAGRLTLDGSSSLSWSIEEGAMASAAERFGGNAEIAADASLIFEQWQDAAYGGALSGAGHFIKTGDSTLVYRGHSAAFAGTTTIDQGMLIVGDTSDGDAMLGGSVKVADGATLGGHGTAGSGVGSFVTIGSGGTLAPGNSIGTLTVDGDLTFEAGSRFEVEVDPQGAASDRVNVTGTATLNGGSVAHVGAGGNYDLRSSYTILSADQLSGAFDEVTSDFAFLTPVLAYDYNAGTIALNLSRNDADFASKAQTHNQRKTASGIDSIGVDAGHAVYDAVAQLPDNAELIGRSLDALSGEIHASVKSALIEDSRFIRNAANDRLRTAFGNTGSSAATYAPGTAPDGAGNVVWSQAFGSWGKFDSNGNAAALDHDTAGLLIGADTQVGNWRLGALAGYSHSTFDADDRDSSGRSDNYHLGVYGGTQWGKLAMRTGMAYSWHDIRNRRSVSIPGLQDSLKSNYDANTFQIFGELGYGIQMGNTHLEPFANVAYVHLHTDGFNEDGGAAALSGKGDSTETAFTTLGLRAAHQLAIGSMDALLRGTLGWRYAFGDVTPESTHRFSAGDAFTVAGVPIARNAAVVEAGVDIGVADNTRIGVSYTGQLADSAHDHGVKADVTIRF